MIAKADLMDRAFMDIAGSERRQAQQNCHWCRYRKAELDQKLQALSGKRIEFYPIPSRFPAETARWLRFPVDKTLAEFEISLIKTSI
ncbi:hypothetical protein J2858_002423 [Neorhizobium galegae]|uniref:hypothetical protein n=1 Tax=Neorhizobium galegae TaxID=399 RepID=UPI001AE7F02C|nr:hypothetical protein [Neorhizobium galegae]MBP2549500.1 hypothetical protein [Neorhizobium galegae]